METVRTLKNHAGKLEITPKPLPQENRRPGMPGHQGRPLSAAPRARAESARRPAGQAPLPSTSLGVRAAAGGPGSGALQRDLAGRGTRVADCCRTGPRRSRDNRGALSARPATPRRCGLRAQRSAGPRRARSLLTFRVHSAAPLISGCGHRRPRRPTATSPAVRTQSPAIVAPADRRSADLSPRRRGRRRGALALRPITRRDRGPAPCRARAGRGATRRPGQIRGGRGPVRAGRG